jgi:hypothetical protein
MGLYCVVLWQWYNDVTCKTSLTWFWTISIVPENKNQIYLREFFEKKETKHTTEYYEKEHNCNVGEGHLDKSKLAPHAVEKGHKIDWTNTAMLQFEANSIRRKYKEAAHILCSNNPIIQPSWDISRVWLPLIDNGGHKWVKLSFMIHMNVWCLVEVS